MHQASRQFIGVINGEIVVHTGVIQFPMRKGWKRIHRLVVLPDYQGIGIGMKFINKVSEIIKEDGYNVNLTTTTPSLINAMCRDKKWLLKRASRVKNTRDKNNQKYYGRKEHKELGSSSNRITYSFNLK